MADETKTTQDETTGVSSQATSEGSTVVDAAAQAQPPAPVGLGKDELQQILNEAIGVASKAGEPQKSPQELQAEFEKAFNVYKFSPEKLAKLGYSEEAIESIVPIYEDMRDGFVRMALSMANYQMGMMRKEMEQQFAPALVVAREHQEERLKVQFLEENPDLKGYEPLLEVLKNNLIASGKKYKDMKEVFTTIATEARTLLSKVKGVQGGGGQGAQSGQQGTHKMSTVSAGGQGGAGGQAGGGEVKSTAKAIFG